jgi:membrane protease subunit HflC
VVALIFLWSSWFTVQPQETGVVQRFGKLVRTAGPGLHFKWPSGIELVDVRIKRLDYIESVREKVYTRMISERKRIAAQFRSEGDGQSAEILGTMEKELRQIRSTAYRQVQELRGEADAEASRIYGEAYSHDPEFYAFSRTLEIYSEGGNQNSVLILTTDSDYYRYLKHAAPKGEGQLPVGGAQDAVALSQ